MDKKLPTIEELLQRIAGGDREALQAFIVRFEPQIRRRIRAKLERCGVPIRDVDDRFSSVCRRLDEAMVMGRIARGCRKTLTAFIFRTAANVAHEHARVEQRASRVLAELASAPAPRTDDAATIADTDVLEHLMDRLGPVESDMLLYRANGVPHKAIAKFMDLSLAAYRKRWTRLRQCCDGLL